MGNINLDFNSVPKELIVLVNILKENKNEIPGEVDWNLFLDLAFHHRLYPLIYSQLKRKGLKWIPQYVIHALEKQYKQNTFRMLHFSAEMQNISQLFSGNQIRLLMLKGPVLALDFYDDLSLRTCGDLDVLVHIKDLGKVDQLLSRQGYTKDDYIQTILGDWKWRHHHVTYFHSEKQIKLEIHWRLNPGPGKEPDFEQLWERRRISSLTNIPVYYLGREDLFYFLVSHGARHGWSRLRWLTDIDGMLKQEIDWQKEKKLLNKYHSPDLAGQALILASQLLQSELTDECESLILRRRSKKLAHEAIFYFEKMVNLHTDPVPVEISAYHKRHLFALMSGKQKMKFLLSTFFPYPEDAETLPLPKQFHFLYFPLRPFLCIWRIWKRQRLRRGIY
jgi:Uncharacterised nucleotidyltransferase